MTPTKNLRVLVVDDEKPIRRYLKATLSSHDYDVFEASTGEEALEKAVSSRPDVIILDLGLPDMDGTDVVTEIRKRSRTPIIILSVREDVSDKIKALDAGADDYLTKPFDTREILGRIRAVMRRFIPTGEDTIFKAGSLSIDLAKCNVEFNGKPVILTPTEYDLLKTLVFNAGRVLTHRHILQEVWNKSDNEPGASHLVRVTIKHLRGKIEPNPNKPAYILTKAGFGYQLYTPE